MLQRTQKMKTDCPEHHKRLFAESKETLEELLERLGVKHVKSSHVTPEHKPQKAIEQPIEMKL